MVKKYKELPIQIRASMWFLACSFLQRGVSVITTPIFTRLLTTAEYGQYSVFNSWLEIVTIFVSLRLFSGVFTRGLIKFSEDQKRFASSIQGLNLVLFLGWTLIYCLFHKFWNELLGLTTIQMLAMLIMIWSSAAFNLWSAEQRVRYRYQVLVAVSLVISIAKPLIGVLCVIKANDKVTARILGLTLVELIGYSSFFFIQLVRGKQFYAKNYWKYAVSFNIPLIPHYLSQMVLNSADRIMIKTMVGASPAGVYSLAYSISQIMMIFNTALSNTISPWIYQKIKDGETKKIGVVAYGSIIMVCVINIMLVLIAPEVLAFFAPKEYYDAIEIIPPVAMSVVFVYSYDLFAKFEFYFEKTKWIMGASIGAAILNIVLNYIFIKQFGYHAAAYTTLFCYIFYTLSHYCFMHKVCKEYNNGEMPYRGRTLLLIYGTFLAIGFLLMATYNVAEVRYSLAVLACFALVSQRKRLTSVAKMLLFKKK